MHPLYHLVIALTVETHYPDQDSAAQGAAELIREFRERLAEDETLVRSSVMVRRTDGELHD